MQKLVLLFLFFIPLTAFSEETTIAQRAIDGLIDGKELNEETLGVKPGWTLPVIMESLNGCESAIIKPALKTYTEKSAKSRGVKSKKDWEYSGRTINANDFAELHMLWAFFFSGNLTANNAMLMPHNICMCQYEHFARQYSYLEFMSAFSNLGAASNKSFKDQVIDTTMQCKNNVMQTLSK